jgi:hypothetical protein
MRARDTSERAAAIQAELNRALGPEKRLRMVMEISDFAREFAKARIREQHPEYDESEVLLALTEELYGPLPGGK